MAKAKQPLLSLDARRKLGDDIVFKRQGRTAIVETRPMPPDARSPGQLSWRHMFLKVVALWHALSTAEKEAWESLGRKRHMTGYAWFVSQALRPNPGIYLPLQGGVMQGIIDMAGYEIQGVKDPVLNQDADTKAAREAAIAAALEDCIDSHIHGWDGSDWQKLKVESNVLHNLRVRLYAGTTAISWDHFNAAGLVGATFDGIGTLSKIYLHGTGGNAFALKNAQQTGDGIGGIYQPPVSLYGYSGTNWDRLRSYGTGILKVGRAEIGLSTPRKTGTGQVKAAPGNLYWMLLNPSAGNSLFELTDDLDGLGAVVLDHFDTARDGHMLPFDPPMEFTTGIYLKTLTNITSIIFGYR